MPSRRDALTAGAHTCAAVLALTALPSIPAPEGAPQRFMLIGLTGPDDPARASLLFVWASALAQAGHTLQVHMAGDGTLLLRRDLPDTVAASGLPPIRSLLARMQDRGVPIFLCQACALARGITDADLEGRNAQFTNGEAMAAAMVWAGKVLAV